MQNMKYAKLPGKTEGQTFPMYMYNAATATKWNKAYQTLMKSSIKRFMRA